MTRLQLVREERSRICAMALVVLALLLAGQSFADEVPTTLHPAWPELIAYPPDVPVWVSARIAFAADGKLDRTLFLPQFRERLEYLLARPKDPAKGCAVIPWIEQDYVNPPDRSTLARAVRSSETVLWGKVVAADVGFERGDLGQLLMVQPIETLKPAAVTPPGRAYFVFVPAGRLSVAGSEFCKEDPRVVVPAVGEEVLLLPFHAPEGESYLNLEYEGSLIAFGPQGETRLPRILASEAAGKAGTAPAKAALIERLRFLEAGGEP